MGYISVDEVKKIRAELKKSFPSKDGWKISVTRIDSSEINVTFLDN